MKIKRPACPLPPVRGQVFSPGTKPGGSPVIGPGKAASVINRQVFWEKMPWDEVNFFHRERWAAFPAAQGWVSVDTFTVQKGLVLVLSGVLFRGSVLLNAPAAPVPSNGYAGDDYFNPPRSYVSFFVSIGGRQIMDRSMQNAGIGQPDFSGWTILNTNIAPLNQDFAVFAAEDSRVDCRAFVSADAVTLYGTEVDFLGVEWFGVWLPLATYNRLREEMR